MLSGEQLGAAIAAAMKAKGVTQVQVAAEFGVKQPSVSSWVLTGRIGKRHLQHLIDYFANVVGPEHWGLSEAAIGLAGFPVQSWAELPGALPNLPAVFRVRIEGAQAIAWVRPGQTIELNQTLEPRAGDVVLKLDGRSRLALGIHAIPSTVEASRPHQSATADRRPATPERVLAVMVAVIGRWAT